MLSLNLVLMMAAGAAAAVDLAAKFTLTEGIGANGVGYTVVTPTSAMCVSAFFACRPCTRSCSTLVQSVAACVVLP